MSRPLFLVALLIGLAVTGSPAMAQSAATSPEAEELKTRVVALAALPDGTLLSGSTFGVVVWDLRPGTGEKLGTGDKSGTADAPKPAWQARPRPGGVLLPDSVTGFALSGKTLVVAHGAAGITLVDVSDPTAMKVLADLLLPGAAIDVVVDQSGLLWVAMGTMGVAAVDISDARAPRLAVHLPLPGYTRHLVPHAITNADAIQSKARYRLWVACGPQGLVQLDLDAAFETLARVRLNDSSDVRRLYRFQQGLLFSRGSAGVCYVPFGGESNQPTASCLPSRDVVRDLTVRDNLVYAADGGAGVLVADFSTPESPRYVRHLDAPKFTANRLLFMDELLLIAADAAGVLALVP